jgi:membrane fusion protein (multidrug efflux system)
MQNDSANEQKKNFADSLREKISSITGKSRKKMLLITAGPAVIIALIVGVPYFISAMYHVSTNDAFIEGTVVPISSRVAGHVAKTYVNDNQWVHTGDVLLELDARDFQAKLDESEASRQSRQINVELTQVASSTELDQAMSNVEAARASVETAQAKVSAAVSNQKQVEAQLASARAALAEVDAEVVSAQAQHQRDADDLKRYQDLVENLIASQQQLDHATADEQISAANLEAVRRKVDTQKMLVVQTEAAVKAAKDNVRQAEAGVTFSKAQLEEAQARLEAAKSAPQRVAMSRSEADAADAESQQARLNLSYTRIVAPCNGYVTKKSVDPGAYVQVGQPLMAIVPPDIWVLANFKETQLTHIRPGQPVDIKVDTYPGVKFKGHVDSIQRGSGARFSLLPPENATGNYIKVVQRVPVKIVFDNSRQLQEYVLSPGMSAVPEIDVSVENPSPNSVAAGSSTPHSGNSAETVASPGPQPNQSTPVGRTLYSDSQ